MEVAFAKRAVNQDAHCGDECTSWRRDGRTILFIGDGLGHGKPAELAVQGAVNYVAQHLLEPLHKLFRGCNEALQSTRGAAIGIAVIDEESGVLTYAGVGNTRALIVKEEVVQLSSTRGIVGGAFKKFTPIQLSLLPGHLVIMYTDGLPEVFDVFKYGRILTESAQHLAQQILRDWGSAKDDAAVLIYRF